tara:strand:+ start:476 stop:868 length:393 start_codon:yes stop_codon:yes gene_type:complete
MKLEYNSMVDHVKSLLEISSELQIKLDDWREGDNMDYFPGYGSGQTAAVREHYANNLFDGLKAVIDATNHHNDCKKRGVDVWLGSRAELEYKKQKLHEDLGFLNEVNKGYQLWDDYIRLHGLADWQEESK